MDNGSSHRGESSLRRLTKVRPRLVPEHGPAHTGWLNRIETCFPFVQRKALTSNNLPCLAGTADWLYGFEHRNESIAQPFEWILIRADLNALIGCVRHAVCSPKGSSSRPEKTSACF